MRPVPHQTEGIVTSWRGCRCKFETRLRRRARELSQPSGAGDDRGGGCSSPAFMALVAASFLLVPFLGSNFFPTVDTGQMQLHARLPVGTRIEDTLQAFGRIEDDVRNDHSRPATWTPSSTISACRASSINHHLFNNTGTIGAQRWRHLHQPERRPSSHRRLYAPAARKTAARFSRRRPFPSRPPTSSARS